MQEDFKSDYLFINIDKAGSNKHFTVISDMKEVIQGFSDSEVEYNYKILRSNEIAVLQNDYKFKKFESERISFKKERKKDDLATKESQLRNAKKDEAKAERLRKEETKTGKLYL